MYSSILRKPITLAPTKNKFLIRYYGFTIRYYGFTKGAPRGRYFQDSLCRGQLVVCTYIRYRYGILQSVDGGPAIYTSHASINRAMNQVANNGLSESVHLTDCESVSTDCESGNLHGL